MFSPTITLKQLKERVPIKTVLSDKGLMTHLRRRGQRLVGPCPVHGGDNPQAFVVDCSRNLWHCFTHCQGGGDVVELLRRLDNSSYRQIRTYLMAMIGTFPTQYFEPANLPPKRTFHPFTRRLILDPGTPFLARKGIDPTTALRFDAGAYSGPGFLAGCLGVRLFDTSGNPLGYAGRRINPQAAAQYGKWKLPAGLPKHTLLYNYHRVPENLQQSLVLVECPWGVMRLAQLQIPAVALLGTHLSPSQQALLPTTTPVILMFDGDQTGRKATLRIHKTLQPSRRVFSLSLPDGTDPDDLSDESLNALLRPLLS